MKKISAAFAFIFSDDDWFNKVLVGGFYLLLSPLLVGLLMIMGFQIEMSRRILKKEHNMPMWRNSAVIFKNGGRLLMVSFLYAAVILLILTLFGIHLFSYTALAVLTICHLLLNPLLIRLYSKSGSLRKCLNPLTVVKQIRHDTAGYVFRSTVTAAMMGLAVLFGWMFIVVGWPLLIFLSMVVQTAVFAEAE
jgi:hypothetical protein